MAEARPIAGQVVLITGAARGIGAEAARQLARKGARLALLGLEPELLEQLAAELPDAASFPCDVTDRAGLEAAVSAAAARFGGIDAVVANAGIATVAPLDTISHEDFERTIDVNLLGVWRTLRATLPHVVERKGYLLPVASLAASLSAPLMGAYPATKAAVEGLANTLRLEMAPRGVAVGCAYFGFIDTDMVRKGFGHPASQTIQQGMPAFMRRPIPVERAGAVIVRGIERRSRRVYAPKWILPALLAGGIFQQLSEKGPDRSRQVLEGERIASEHPLGPTTEQPSRNGRVAHVAGDRGE